MITFSKFGKHGRLGNQLFQIASMIGFSKKYDRTLLLPTWVYSKYFNVGKHCILRGNDTTIHGTRINEKAFHYTTYDDVFWSQSQIDFHGYFQSEKYWEHCKKDILEAFEFSGKAKVDFPFNNNKTNIAISIRRGDYVDNPNYELLPITYYFLALQEHFPNWQDCNLLIFSDDTDYCKVHFECLPNAFIVQNKFDNTNKRIYFDLNHSAIEQLQLMSMCDHFILSNSTFAWWGAYLGERKHSKIIRPVHYLSGKLKEQCNMKDHYPERWIAFDHKDEYGEFKKIDLKDVTFTVPVSYDHNDRRQNLGLNICLLQRYFDTNIIIGEHGSDYFGYFIQWCDYVRFYDEEFHRTKFLNRMATMAITPIISNWDADVFISPVQIWKSVESIRNGADMVFPYDGRFARVDRKKWFHILEKRLDIGIFQSSIFKGMRTDDKLSVGGAIFFNRERFLDGGGENERFVAYGPEDVERDVRFRKIGYDVRRTKGVLYHMDHYKGPNSKCDGNKYDKQNHDELEKIYSLSQEELLKYIKTWK